MRRNVDDYSLRFISETLTPKMWLHQLVWHPGLRDHPEWKLIEEMALVIMEAMESG
jgi:hypothetical protein